jgi:hypothetical protein
MQPLEPFLIFTRKLNDLGVRYMVTGSTAAIYYGEPRMTNDVDIVLFLRRQDSTRFAQAFPPEEFYCPPEEVIGIELSRQYRGHFNLIHHETGFKADIYLMAGDPLHQWGMDKARIVKIGDDTVQLAPPEYVILRKLQFFREGGSNKHPRDIARMLDSLGPDWERSALLGLVERHGLQAEWTAALELVAGD